MRPESLFINGVFSSVLEEIIEVQGSLPEHVMYLQPYASKAIARLRENPPSADDSVLLVVSTTDDLSMIRYAGEIIGWDDKTLLSDSKRRVLNRVISALQPGEGELYDASPTSNRSLNLLHVRRIRRVREPFSVSRLRKSGDGSPVSDGRTQSGGWTYIESAGVVELTR